MTVGVQLDCRRVKRIIGLPQTVGETRDFSLTTGLSLASHGMKLTRTSIG